jgi:hypothetical protein
MKDDLGGVSMGADRKAIDSGYRDTLTGRIGPKQSALRKSVTGRDGKETSAGSI